MPEGLVWSFGIRHWSFFRHSTFVIRHSSFLPRFLMRRVLALLAAKLVQLELGRTALDQLRRTVVAGAAGTALQPDVFAPITCHKLPPRLDSKTAERRAAAGRRLPPAVLPDTVYVR